MTLVGYLMLAGVLAAAIVHHVRLNRALARVESLYVVLLGLKYRLREAEHEACEAVDELRYELNPAARPASAHGGCGSGCGSHGDHQQATVAPAGQLLQIH